MYADCVRCWPPLNAVNLNGDLCTLKLSASSASPTSISRPHTNSVAWQAAAVFQELLEKALALVRGCGCSSVSGCPACTQHVGCNEYNAVLHRRCAQLVLEITLQAEEERRTRLHLQVSAPGLCTCTVASNTLSWA